MNRGILDKVLFAIVIAGAFLNMIKKGVLRNLKTPEFSKIIRHAIFLLLPTQADQPRFWIS